MNSVFTLSTLSLLLFNSSIYAAEQLTRQSHTDDTDTEVLLVIGSRLDSMQQELEIPRSMTIITDKHLQNAITQELSDALRQTPSIATSNNSRPLAGQISIRGFGNERIHLDVDGVRYQQYSDGSATNAYLNPLDIDPSIVRAVEITRGADGIAQGSGAIGGQVRVVTKGGWDYTGGEAGLGGIVRAAYGDAPDLRQYGSTLFYADDSFAAALHSNRRRFGEMKVNLTDSSGELRGQTKRIKNDSQNDDLRLKLEHRQGHHYVSGHTQLTRNDVADLPFRNTDSWADQPLTETERSKRISQSLEYRYQGEQSWQNLQAQLYLQRFERDRLQQGEIILGELVYPFHNDDSFRDQNQGLKLSQQWFQQGQSWSGVLTSFLQMDRGQFRDHAYDHLSESTSTYYGRSKGSNWAAGMRYDADWSHWLSSEAGLRYDQYRRRSEQFEDAGVNSDGSWSSNLGVTIRPTEWLRFYSRYNESFRGPNLRELYKQDEWRCHRPTKICYSAPQPDLQAEKSRNLEVGTGLVFQQLAFADQLMLKLNWFQTEVRDFIDTAPFMYKLVDGEKVFASPLEATHRDYSSRNISKLESRGWEFELTYRYRQLGVFANYSRVRMDVTGIPNFFLGTIEERSQPYERAPQDSINLGLNWQLPAGFSLTTVSRLTRDMKRLPQLYLDRDMDGKGSQLHHMYLSYQPEYSGWDGLIVRLGIENLTNRSYALWPDPENQSMPGRNTRLSISYQF